MFAGKKLILSIFIGIAFCYGLSADDIMGTYFNTEELNNRIKQYNVNVSNLIPDSSTLQNVWTFVPTESQYWFGAGLNFSFTFLERKLVSSALSGTENFGQKQGYNDLSQFPMAIPYLPGASFDIRVGFGKIDVGLCGMWLDDNQLADTAGIFLGEGNNFTYKMFGADVRYLVLKRRGPIPDVTVQAGYYFTWMSFGITAGYYDSEKVNAEFRNDSYLLSVQASYNLAGFIRPYVGAKYIVSKTDSSFMWETHRPILINNDPYPNGAIYSSGAKDGDSMSYLQITAGLGLSFLYQDLISIGGAYNVVTNHFGVNISARMILGY
jgi:hypothetical protein